VSSLPGLAAHLPIFGRRNSYVIGRHPTVLWDRKYLNVGKVQRKAWVLNLQGVCRFVGTGSQV
jgi:hypothetical protein